MKNFVLLALLLSGNLFSQSLSSAPQEQPLSSVRPALEPRLAPRIGIVGQVQITLPEVLVAVLSNNRDISVANLGYKKAILTLRAAKGYFDPVVGGSGHVLRQVNPQTSSLGGAINGAVTQTEVYADPQVSGNSPWLGTSYKVDFSSSRIDNTNTFNTLNPTYPTAANLNLVQPLWGGLLFDTNRERVLVARKNIQQTESQFKQRVIEVTAQAIRAYWELDYAVKNLELQIDAVRLAEKQDTSNRHQVELGTEAAIDLVQTQVQISGYQQNVFNAQQQVAEAENALKRLMLADQKDPLWNMGVQTVTPALQGGPIPTLEDAMSQAFAERPDLKAGQAGLQVTQLDARLSREQVRPQVNLTATLSAQGLAGRAVAGTTSTFGTLFTPLFTRVNELSTLAGLEPIDTSELASTSSVPSFFVGGYGRSLSSLKSLRFPTVEVGIQISLPVGNRTAHANSEIAEANQKQTLSQQQQLEMTVVSEVRNTLQRLVNTDAVVEAAHRSVHLSEQQYESEQRQFHAGLSSVFLVLQRQIEFTNARSRELRAVVDNQEAQADFDRATANTLRRENIDIKEQEARKP